MLILELLVSSFTFLESYDSNTLIHTKFEVLGTVLTLAYSIVNNLQVLFFHKTYSYSDLSFNFVIYLKNVSNQQNLEIKLIQIVVLCIILIISARDQFLT